MKPVAKKLNSVFSPSPTSSPKLKPAKPSRITTSDSTAQQPPATMPCSCQLFDLFKLMAGGNTAAGLTGGDVDSDEEDLSSGHSSDSGEQAAVATNKVTAEPGRIDESARKTEKQRKTLSARFTALSLSNLVSSSGRNTSKKTNVPLSGVLDESDADAEVPESPLDRAPGQLPDYASTGLSDISTEEKLQAIVNEFGDIAGLVQGGAPEVMLGEAKGSLFKGVLMVGNIHLTSYRLLFHALIPPDSETSTFTYTGTPAGDGPQNQPDIVHAGPVTIHRPNTLTKSRRVWMELTSEMVTTYPSAEEKDLVRPLRCVLLSAVHNCDPLDPEKPCDFYVTYDTPVGLRKTHFTVDTEQSALQWRRGFESALYRNAKSRWQSTTGAVTDDWATMRCCMPLDRVKIKGITDYHSFATLIGLDVMLDEDSANAQSIPQGDLAGDDAPVELRAKGRATTLRYPSLSRRSSSPAPESPKTNKTVWIDSTLPPKLVAQDRRSSHLHRWKHEVDFNMAIFNDQPFTAEVFQSAVEKASEVTYKPDVEPPPVIFQIAGHDCLAADDTLDLGSSRASSLETEDVDEESSQDQFLHETRKAEKAAMAAKVFGLREDEPIWIKRCYVATAFVPARGHIIITPKYLCFWRRNAVGPDIKYRFHIEDVKGAGPAPAIRLGFHGMALHIHGHRDLRFEFWVKESRDEVLQRLSASLPHLHDRAPSLLSDQKPPPPLYEPSLYRSDSPGPVGEDHPADILAPRRNDMFDPRNLPDEAITYMPFIANRPSTKQIRLTPRTFTLLTIGSRGDVQPYIALGVRLLKDGHKVVIVTHGEFKKWVEGYGIEHRQAGGDPTALMKLSQEHKMFSPGFFKESLGGFRTWLDDLLYDSWTACHDADVLIESPSTMAGIHIAEALKIPYFRAFTMPWTRTAAYPHAFMVPAFEMGPSFNYSTYVLFDNIMWKATAGQINRWRKKHLKIRSTDMNTLSVTKVPFLYNFSSAVVPKPLDWHDDITITGYWTLEDSDTDWTPSPELDEFVKRAKEDGKALVYIGFGSIVVPRPNEMTRSIIQAVEKADVRAIIAKGWSSRGGDPATEGEDIEFPPSCFGVEKIPHSWLFPKVQAALHHGGAGTVGASLRAGVPTLIKPWFGDQFFWSVRVTKLGVGLKVASLRSEDIASALVKATTDRVMIEKAARIGEKIRAESGVDNALQAIHSNLTRAATDRRGLKWAH